MQLYTRHADTAPTQRNDIILIKIQLDATACIGFLLILNYDARNHELKSNDVSH